MAYDYVIRFGGDGFMERTFRMTEREANRFYNKIELNTSITWKELWYEPLDDLKKQVIVRSDAVKVLDLGIGKIALPERW